MTDKEIFEDINKWCLCSKCEHKRTLCYRPIRNSEEEITGYEDVRSSCYERTPMLEPSEVDGKYGLHSLPVPKQSCKYFKEKKSKTFTDKMIKLEEYTKNINILQEYTNQVFVDEQEEFDNLFKNKTIQELINI